MTHYLAPGVPELAMFALLPRIPEELTYFASGASAPADIRAFAGSGRIRPVDRKWPVWVRQVWDERRG